MNRTFSWQTVTIIEVIEPSQRWIVPALGEKLRASGLCGEVGVHLNRDALRVSWRRGQDPAAVLGSITRICNELREEHAA